MSHELPIAPTEPAIAPVPSTEARPLRFSKKSLGLALAVAAVADAIGVFATPAPPIVWAVDVVTAVLLFYVLGWQWLLLPGLIMEAIPGVGVMPFWLLVVTAIAVSGTPRPALKQ
jgi:hypothetical protein